MTDLSLWSLPSKESPQRFQSEGVFFTGGRVEMLTEDNHTEVVSGKYLLISASTNGRQSDALYIKTCGMVHLPIYPLHILRFWMIYILPGMLIIYNPMRLIFTLQPSWSSMAFAQWRRERLVCPFSTWVLRGSAMLPLSPLTSSRDLLVPHSPQR